MGDFFAQTWEMLGGRVHGPFAFRLVLQPLAAAFIACRAGLRDARAGRSAYGWTVVTSRGDRRELLQQGWKELTRVFIVAVIVDLLYQVIVFRRVYPGQSLFVAGVLALLPYPLIRGSVNRIVRWWNSSRGGPHGAPSRPSL